MSIESVAIALHHSQAKGTTKLVLIGLANHDGDGGAFPKIATLAKYAGVHPRHVVRCLNQLGALGEIIIHQSQGGTARTPEYVRPNLYEFTLECPAECDRTKNHRIKDEKLGRKYKGNFVPDPVDNSPDDLVTPASPGDTHVTTPGDTHVTTPGDTHVTTPGDTHVTTPGDTHVTTPGDTHVTTKNHQVEPPIESGGVGTSPALEAGVDKPLKVIGLTAEQMYRNRLGAAKARAALRAKLVSTEAKDVKP